MKAPLTLLAASLLLAACASQAPRPDSGLQLLPRWHTEHLDAAGTLDRQWWTTFDVTVKREPGQIAAWTDDGGYIGEATWRGRHIGPFLGIAPTGRPIVIPFVVVLGFRDGLMLSEGFHYDLASLLCSRVCHDVISPVGAIIGAIIHFNNNH